MDQKLFATLQAILLFYILSHPIVYKITGLGHIAHALIFGVIVRILMGYP